MAVARPPAGGGSAVVLALLVALLGGCATPTPYRPAVGSDDFGYTEQRIEADRYRVVFTGNDATPPSQVRDHALYRAAELTVAAGYDHFAVARQLTESRASGVTPARIGVGGGDNGIGVGFSTALGVPGTHATILDVVMFRDAPPEDAVDHYDARAVLGRLGPTVARHVD